ncbi:MAG: hypothetical protein ACJ780_11310 [Solirubrobacteraceae bacterium]
MQLPPHREWRPPAPTRANCAPVGGERALQRGAVCRALRELITGIGPGYTRSQMTYDLRRLRRKGLIRRVPKPSATS